MIAQDLKKGMKPDGSEAYQVIDEYRLVVNQKIMESIRNGVF